MIARDFKKLVTSIKQACKIRRGNARPSRVFRVKAAEVKAIRARLKQAQSEFAP